MPFCHLVQTSEQDGFLRFNILLEQEIPMEDRIWKLVEDNIVLNEYKKKEQACE